mgnify:CR=1 FL=1
MQFDPNELDYSAVYKLLTGAIIPRPIGWISSISEDGINNLAPFSYFNAVGDDQPHVMFSAGTAPASPLAGGTAGGLGSLFGRFKAWISQGAGSSFTWVTETWATGGMSWTTDGQPKGLSSKHGHGYGSTGSYPGTIYLYKFSEATGSNLATITRPKNNGEENWQIGQNWGYMLGAYDAAPLGQNNDAEKVNYLTDTSTAMGSDTQPKGHDGASSGSCATGSAAFVGY